MKTELPCGCKIELYFNWQGWKTHKIIKKCSEHKYNDKLYELERRKKNGRKTKKR